MSIRRSCLGSLSATMKRGRNRQNDEKIVREKEIQYGDTRQDTRPSSGPQILRFRRSADSSSILTHPHQNTTSRVPHLIHALRNRVPRLIPKQVRQIFHALLNRAWIHDLMSVAHVENQDNLFSLSLKLNMQMSVIVTFFISVEETRECRALS